MASDGRTREAIEEFAAAVKYAPDDVQARFRLAEALRQSRRAQEALSHYEHVLRVDPHMVEARFGYAMALVLLKRYAEARERLTEDAKRYPDRPEFGQALEKLR
jgi:tetratricopeptide (TPR) repeat protein